MLRLSIIYNLLGDLGQGLFIRSCHEDVIFTRKSHNCAGTAFVQGDSVGGSKLTEQTFFLTYTGLYDLTISISNGLLAYNFSYEVVEINDSAIQIGSQTN